MPIIEELQAKFAKLPGGWQTLLPVFGAMDVSKKGSLQPSEFKTCLLALAIRASKEEVRDCFRVSGGDFLLPNGGILYKNFIRALGEGSALERRVAGGAVEVPIVAVPRASALTAVQAEEDLLFYYAGAAKSKPSTPRSQSQSLSSLPSSPPPPRRTVGTAVFIPTPKYVAPDGKPLSDEVGDFEDRVDNLEQSLQTTVSDYEATNAKLAQARGRMAQIEKYGAVTVEDMSDEIDDKTQQIAGYGSTISKLAESLNGLDGKAKELREHIADKRAQVQRNAVRRADKEQVVKQLGKAMEENEAQLAELSAVYEELVQELAAVDAHTATSNDHVNLLLSSDAQPPQSMTLRSEHPAGLTAAQRHKVKKRNEDAAEQHRVNLMRRSGGHGGSAVWAQAKRNI